MSLPWKGIVIHHSLTKDGETVSWNAIRRYHIDPQGPPQYRMREIGYHAGVEMVSGAYECLLGRPLDWFGAHTVGVNRTHLGFLFVGNFDLAPPPSEMMQVACERAIRPWMKAFGIGVDDIRPHREFADKTCPGRFFEIAELIDVLEHLRAGDF